MDFDYTTTGHGIGFGLNVVEGPHAIDTTNDTPFVPGMFVTIEPGYYEKDVAGYRIENVVYVADHPTLPNKL
jgi:Xaa-Pro aminopeptidase